MMNKGKLLGRLVNMQQAGGVAIGVGIILFFVFAAVDDNPHKNTALTALILVAAVTSAAWGIYISYMVNKLDERLWARFAAGNNWQLSAKNTGIVLVPPSIKGIGHGIHSGRVINGNLGETGFSFFSYSFTTGSGKYQVPHNKLVFCADLGREAPYILLVRKLSLHQQLGDITDPFNKPIDGQKIELEGDFGKYYEVYGQKGADIPIREIITPDIMQLLAGLELTRNIEFSAGNLYLSTDGYQTSIDKITSLFGVAEKVLAGLAENYKLAHGTLSTATVNNPI